MQKKPALLAWLILALGSAPFFMAFCSSAPAPNPNSGADFDLRVPMALAAGAIPPRLDPHMGYRPWFMLRGRAGIPATPEHASWDLGDMTGRYLEGLILARRMGITAPELSQAESRLEHNLFELMGPDGVVRDPKSGAVDHSFSQGSAMYGLLAWFEDTGDPAVRRALEHLISGQLKRLQRQGDKLIDPTVKLAESSGSHLAGYQIYPAIRFYELTAYPDALVFAEGLTRWALDDPVLGPDGAITKPLSWEGHIHSWLDTLAGCARTAHNSRTLDRPKVLARCRAVYEWVKTSNATSFGWIATYPTGGSSETCAISSAIRLALELAAGGDPQCFDDIERFVRNQVVEAQFKNLTAYEDGTNHASPLLLGCFDSQSMPNCHLGTRGGEDVGTVEGCCLNGGMRALALAWEAIESANERGTTINIGLTRHGPAADVRSFEPLAGRLEVTPRVTGPLRIRLAGWVAVERVSVLVDDKPTAWKLEKPYVCLNAVPAGARVSLQYPLREVEEAVTAGGQSFHIRWKGNVVVGVDPPGKREPTYQRTRPKGSAGSGAIQVNQATAATGPDRRRAWLTARPDTYELPDAARLAAFSMLSRLDLQRGGQPFFRIYPFADPPRAEHEKWDDGDMSGRYVEALILARRQAGLAIDPREPLLRTYLESLYDAGDGLCYTRGTAWVPHRACLFSQSSAMLGLLAWYRETGLAQVRERLDQQVDGLMRIAVTRDTYAYFPKYEFDGRSYVDDPPGKDAPIWYGGRLILPLVDYWQITGRDDVKGFIEKLVRYCTEVSHFIKPDGEVERGEGWWGHLHSTMDMTAGIAEFGRLTHRTELVEWARRVYDWIGRTHTTRYGWVADVSGGRICEACAIASRIRLGLALYQAGVVNPFGEIDRHLRNQLLEDQFRDLSFMAPLKPGTPRTDRAVYYGVDCMVRGTFQCWGTANDLIGNDDIEGCGAGGGVQGLALALRAQSEWRERPGGKELRVHLLFNRALRAEPQAPFTTAAPVAAQMWSCLPQEGKVLLEAHQPLHQLALRLPDGADRAGTRLRRSLLKDELSDTSRAVNSPELDGDYALVPEVKAGELIELTFPLQRYETTEHAAGVEYKVQWKGSWVTKLAPGGARVPLYSRRCEDDTNAAPLSAPRYPQ